MITSEIEKLQEKTNLKITEIKQLLKYHKEFSPTFSTSLSKNKKYKDVDNIKGSFMTSGNKSWTITVRIGGKKKPIYLGTQLKVNEMLDLIEGRSDYWINLYPHKRPEHETRIKRVIEKLVYPLIKKEMFECLEKEGSLNSFMGTTIKGKKYLDELYLDSGFYEERKPMESKFKGKFIVYNKTYIKDEK